MSERKHMVGEDLNLNFRLRYIVCIPHPHRILNFHFCKVIVVVVFGKGGEGRTHTM